MQTQAVASTLHRKKNKQNGIHNKLIKLDLHIWICFAGYIDFDIDIKETIPP